MVEPEWEAGQAGWSDGKRENVDEVWGREDHWTGPDRRTGWGNGLPAPPFLGGTAPFLALGVLLVVVAGFLLQVASTSEGPQDGLHDVASWFAWLGRAVVALGLLAAATRPSTASPPLRFGLLALGLLVLLGLLQAGPAALLGGLFGSA